MPDQPSWGDLAAEIACDLASASGDQAEVDARRICEAVSGYIGADWHRGREEAATKVGAARARQMAAARAQGEPLQYVLGEWSFRSLDLMVDRRVLIPRPETESVAEAALREVDRLAEFEVPVVVVDLGTGSGAIGLAIACERLETRVVLTDRSADALAVARANLAGVGRAATRVSIAEGSWFDAFDDDLRGRLHVVVSNPPYVADGVALPPEVADYEPADALRAGPDGLDDIRQIVEQAPGWLCPRGSLVVEISPEQATAVRALAQQAGFADVSVAPDLAGRDRALVARMGR